MEPLSTLFVQILEIAHQMGLVGIGDVVIDGSKANPSKHKYSGTRNNCATHNLRSN